jgi:hypothetical protein
MSCGKGEGEGGRGGCGGVDCLPLRFLPHEKGGDLNT